MKYYKTLIVFIILFLIFPILVFAENFKITGQNVILYNLNDNEILYEKNSEDKTSIASLTKIMTSIIALENINNLDENITIKDQDYYGTDGYAKAGFEIGEVVTYRDLLYGILLPSGAEAVNAVVNNTLGEKEFIEAMNQKARQIGLKNTKFANAVGKDDENNYSTARDVAKLLQYALKNKTFQKIFTTNQYVASNGLKLEKTIMTYKNILDTDLIIGSKSGFTSKAGRCLASITTLNDVDYLLVIINSSKEEPYNAISDTINIYKYYSENYSYQSIITDDTIIKTIPIKWSKEKEYTITGSEEIKKFLENKQSENITYEYDGVEEITINTQKGAKLGTVNIYQDDELLATTPIFLEKDITYYHPIIWLISGILLVIIILLLNLKKKNDSNLVY